MFSLIQKKNPVLHAVHVCTVCSLCVTAHSDTQTYTELDQIQHLSKVKPSTYHLPQSDNMCVYACINKQ